ncbi:hypothetical protein ACN38_g3340 [Penicillium nordicum]|uniref:Uncharacterized protein n=1 Tax=Penicillium nordicum TaxID=229535 RepID=A0A0M8PCE8_9EURO|nr:hypothetical protein ACN38_g3340 [Penicillium nordicum]
MCGSSIISALTKFTTPVDNQWQPVLPSTESLTHLLFLFLESEVIGVCFFFFFFFFFFFLTKNSCLFLL